MAWYKCIGSSGGGTLPTGMWYGTKSQFDAISVKNPNVIYYVKRLSGGYLERNADLRGIYVGDTQIFPPSKNGYDLWVENLFFPDTNESGLQNIDYQFDTGLAFCSADNVDRDWQMEFKATLSTTANLSGDQTIIGCGSNGSYLSSVYFNTSGGLCVYGAGISDGQKVADCNGHDIKFVFSRANNSMEIYRDGTLETTLTEIGSVTASDQYELGFSKYSNSYRFHGTINYFKFKWLS